MMGQPSFVRRWQPERVQCQICLPSSGIRAPIGTPCEICRRVVRPLYIQTYQIAHVAFYFGLCPRCLEIMQDQLKEGETHQ